MNSLRRYSRLAIGLFAIGSGHAFAATVTFSNRVFNQVVAPVYGPEPTDWSLTLQGNTSAGTPPGTQVYSGDLLAGTGFTAELWAGPENTAEADLVPIPDARTTFQSTRPGFLVASPSVVDIPFLETLDRAVLQLRVWDNTAAESWAEVLASPHVLRGVSPPFVSLPLGGPVPDSPDIVPPFLVGLQSFNLHVAVPEVAGVWQTAVFVAAASASCLARRRAIRNSRNRAEK